MNDGLFAAINNLMNTPVLKWLGDQNIHLISPEIMILFVLIFSLFKAVATKPEDQKDAWIISLLGIIFTLICLFSQSIVMTMPPALLQGAMAVGNQNLLVDSFSWMSRIFLVLGSGLVILLSRDFINSRSKSPAEFYVLILSALLGGMFLVSANDLVMLFVALETLSISSYILAGYLRDESTSREASLKYLIYGGVSSAVLLFGFSLLYGLSGGLTNLTEIAAVLHLSSSATLFPILPILGVMIIGAFAFKLSLAPFHMWTPDIYEAAPTPVTAFLSVVSKMAAFIITIRFVLMIFPHQPGLSLVFAALALISMVWGNIAALTQTNAKRLLAFSTVAHAGYMVLGLVALGANALAASVFYLIGYLFTNLGAFAAIAEIEKDLGSTDIQTMSGLVKKRPALVFCLSLFLLSLAGIPITAGFFAKFFLFQSVIQNEPGLLWLIVVALLTSTISLYYYLNVIRVMVVSDPSDAVRYLKADSIRILPSPLAFTVSVCLFFTLTLGLVASPMIWWIQSTINPLVASPSNTTVSMLMGSSPKRGH